jgi:hypothetical protein
MLREVVCPKCSVRMSWEEAKRSKTPKKSRTLCVTCKEEWRQSVIDRNKSQKQRDICSKNMKDNNPMFNKDTCKKVGDTLRQQYSDGVRSSPFMDSDSLAAIRAKRLLVPYSEEERKSASERMKKNNPMFNESSKKKMSKTFRDKVASGDIKYKRGPEHHLWKGNRTFSDLCRQLLYPVWTSVILNRDGYACTICSKKENLQVHHIRPLRDFVESIREKYTIEESFMNIDDETKFKYAEEIVANHKLEDGITVCPVCHSKIDNLYKVK